MGESPQVTCKCLVNKVSGGLSHLFSILVGLYFTPEMKLCEEGHANRRHPSFPRAGGQAIGLDATQKKAVLQLPGSDWLCSDASEFEAKTI